MNDHLKEAFGGREHQEQTLATLWVGDVEDDHELPATGDCTLPAPPNSGVGAPVRVGDMGGGTLGPRFLTARRAYAVAAAFSITVSGIAAGCGGSSSPAAAKAHTGPAECLRDSRLTGVVQVDGKTWRGFHTENGQADFYAVFIDRERSIGAAAQFAADAADAIRAQSGRYVVLGPSKTGGAYPNIAQGLVDGIAACLG